MRGVHPSRAGPEESRERGSGDNVPRGPEHTWAAAVPGRACKRAEEHRVEQMVAGWPERIRMKGARVASRIAATSAARRSEQRKRPIVEPRLRRPGDLEMHFPWPSSQPGETPRRRAQLPRRAKPLP